MTFLVLGVVVLALGGCGCVVWADRGGPRWVRMVARVTVGVGELLRRAQRDRRRGLGRGSGGGGGAGDSDG
ncbi:hypothetical protein F4556_000539 [Kitasatospora gansuensis]|uniref:Uncharacterized protein n=1 Tax=Kitasatospora gansuensis TaxID=258050 RepID=A0A7W7S6U8_9ACTN|nr:hypothetical protein [Kitasatospora gansuensis]MBB4945004.1 hypothetical protein [Kitasatospora gansuensis]